MNFRKTALALLSLVMITGCSQQKTEKDPERPDDLNELRVLLLPTIPADTVLPEAEEIADIMEEEMLKNGYQIGDITFHVSESYEDAGESLAAGKAHLAFLPAGSYVQYPDQMQVILTAETAGLSNDSANPADWNGEDYKTMRTGTPVTHQKTLIFAGPSEYGKKLAQKVNNGEALTWDDLTGARWAAGNKPSASAYIYPELYLKNNYDGRTLSDLNNLEHLSITESFHKAAEEEIDVFVCYADGRMDYEAEWNEEWGREDSIWNECQVLAVAPDMINDAAAITLINDLVKSDSFVEALQNALIQTAETKEGKEFFSLYAYDGFQKASDSDYDTAREALAVTGRH